MRFKGTNASVRKEWFEAKTREEQEEYVSNLQELKPYKKEEKVRRIKEMLNGVNAAIQKSDSESERSEDKTGNSRGNSKKSRSKKSED